MACYHPITVGVKRRPITPGGIRVIDDQTVPCGRCLGCRADQARDWALRIMHESQFHDHAWFLTLTYAPENIPDAGTLNPDHTRDFIKRLRKTERRQAKRENRPPTPFSYYLCGEYGDLTERPHYHAILYGPSFQDKSLHRSSGDYPVFTSGLLDHHWKLGLSEFGVLTPESASYVAGYVRKKVSKKVSPDHYTRVDPSTGELVELQPEFARMSLRPAIGRRFIEKYWRDVYPRDIVIDNGKELRPPRYYDRWMLQDHNESECGTTDCAIHKHIFMQTLEQREKDGYTIDRRQREAKEAIHKSRVQLFQGRSAI